jgi:hypothetical protein
LWKQPGICMPAAPPAWLRRSRRRGCPRACSEPQTARGATNHQYEDWAWNTLLYSHIFIKFEPRPAKMRKNGGKLGICAFLKREECIDCFQEWAIAVKKKKKMALVRSTALQSMIDCSFGCMHSFFCP